jgi:uncharacterized protein (TIGR01777 family)
LLLFSSKFIAMEKVLITGASGLVGTRLTQLLLNKGYTVNTLGRKTGGHETIKSGVKAFGWNIATGELDARAFEGVTAIIHLAGAGIADKRWTDERKKEIIDSRVKGAKLIFDQLKKDKKQVRAFISASAVGFYGDCDDEIVTEEHKPGKDFLAEVCKKWEAGAKQFTTIGIREVRCRLGIVISDKGGALPQLIQTLPVGIATYFAKNNLYYPWIHLDDVCGILMHAIENETVSGAYNTTAPQPLLMKDLMSEIVEAKKSKALLVPAPPFAIKLAMGEMSEMLLCSQRCSAQKVIDSGYKFRFGQIQKALKDIFK